MKRSLICLSLLSMLLAAPDVYAQTAEQIERAFKKNPKAKEFLKEHPNVFKKSWVRKGKKGSSFLFNGPDCGKNGATCSIVEVKTDADGNIISTSYGTKKRTSGSKLRKERAARKAKGELVKTKIKRKTAEERRAEAEERRTAAKERRAAAKKQMAEAKKRIQAAKNKQRSAVRSLSRTSARRTTSDRIDTSFMKAKSTARTTSRYGSKATSRYGSSADYGDNCNATCQALRKRMDEMRSNLENLGAKSSKFGRKKSALGKTGFKKTGHKKRGLR